jgi:superfamily II DNA or RNA helicase
MEKKKHKLEMYLGNKGYTIPKHLLTDSQLYEVKRELTFAPKSYLPAPPFYSYRESTNKLYVPRFYGVSKFGDVESRLAGIESIDVAFQGKIRDAQVPAVDAFLEKKHGLLELPCGFGKTILGLYLIASLKVKTLIVVHKEFLLEQWLERIAEFLPTAKVGRIQGNVVDSDGKDIVIGMLQSLSMKEYEPDLFRSFGFTIIDETHHIVAEVFSNALFKIVTPYMLGLSATMERADGLTKVFKLFLGDVCFSVKREKNQSVVVQAIRYVHPDKDYNEVVLNFKGQANYAVMMRKLCEFNPRKDFIVRVIAQVVADGAEQIMVLSHSRAQLEYFHAAIQHQNLATCAFYVGGMKSTALKESESARVILATFAMAEEALDIKTLTTLVLATPKTNVTQAVGRILRMAHAKPLVVDIVDSHETFSRQWKKRRAFYSSNGYVIQDGSCLTYPEMRLPTPKKEKAVCLLEF